MNQKISNREIQKMFTEGTLQGENVTGLNCYPDKIICKRDGTMEFRRGYFYRHGYSPEKFAADIVSDLQRVGVTATIEHTYDNFQPWPRDSYFQVIIKVS